MLSDFVSKGWSVGIASAVVFGLTVVYYAIQYTRHELRIQKTGGVRAPRLASNPISAALWIMQCGRAHMQNRLLEYFDFSLHQAGDKTQHYAEIQVHPGQRYIITRDPEHIKTILTTKFGSFGKGPLFHELWSPFLGDSIFTTDGPLWHDSRNLIRPMFIKDRVSDLATFERWTVALIDKLPPSGRETDLMDLFYRMTLDVTTDFLLGASANSLANPRSEFARAFNEVQRIQMYITMLEPFKYLVPRGRYNAGIRTIDRFVMPYIQAALALPQDELEKKGNSDRDFTFLHAIARYTRDPKMLRDQLVAVLLAGRDTTAATLSWAFYELSRCPVRYARLRAEILDKVGRHRTPTYEDLKSMPYLHHVLNETLRLYPAVPYNLRVALEDTTIPGAQGKPHIGVVEGDVVVYSVLSMQRRADLYPEASDKEGEGEGGGLDDPTVWSPERWERGWSPKPWHYVPFNGGPRICVGQNFAMTEMSYVIVRILQKFDRLEYAADWNAQYHEAEVVGRPGQGVRIRLYEERVQTAER